MRGQNAKNAILANQSFFSPEERNPYQKVFRTLSMHIWFSIGLQVAWESEFAAWDWGALSLCCWVWGWQILAQLSPESWPRSWHHLIQSSNVGRNLKDPEELSAPFGELDAEPQTQLEKRMPFDCTFCTNP